MQNCMESADSISGLWYVTKALFFVFFFLITKTFLCRTFDWHLWSLPLHIFIINKLKIIFYPNMDDDKFSKPETTGYIFWSQYCEINDTVKAKSIQIIILTKRKMKTIIKWIKINESPTKKKCKLWPKECLKQTTYFVKIFLEKQRDWN
jgi:hypothetical protein